MSTTMRDKEAAAGDAVLKAAVIQAAAPVVLALAECDEELRKEAFDLFKQLNSGSLDEDQRQATVSLLTEILFAAAESPGADLHETEAAESQASAAAADVQARMEHEEAAFADRLRELMDRQGITQEQLAEKLGVGQPAISMMLQRNCRPQKRTVQRLAAALGVAPEDLWPRSDSLNGAAKS